MIRASLLVLAAAAAVAAPDVSPLPPAAGQAVDFVKDIAPIFEAKCLKCHGADKQKSGYRLDVKSIALTGGDEHAPNIVPGKSAESPLVKFVAGLDPDVKMPPKGERLSAVEIGLLRAWIDAGAQWPESAGAKAADPLDWWSLRPLKSGKRKAEIRSTDLFLRSSRKRDSRCRPRPMHARFAGDSTSTSSVSRRPRRSWMRSSRRAAPISQLSALNSQLLPIASSPRLATANAGRGTGLMSSTTATRTATTKTSRVRMRGPIATM